MLELNESTWVDKTKTVRVTSMHGLCTGGEALTVSVSPPLTFCPALIGQFSLSHWTVCPDLVGQFALSYWTVCRDLIGHFALLSLDSLP